MKLRKVLAVPIAALAALGLLAGCSGGNTEDEEASTGTFRTEISAEEIVDIVNTDDITVTAGQSVQDAMNRIIYDPDTVNYVSFSFNDVDFETAGVYTAHCTVNVSVDTADEILQGRSDLDEYDDVSFAFAFPVTVVSGDAGESSED